jgi:molecular chaperone GrpE
MYKNGIPADYLVRQTQQFKPVYRMQINETKNNHETEVASLKRELAAERERYLRLAADFDNHRKRVSREQERRAASQKEALVRDLLPAVDNLERALTAKIRSDESFFKGVKMVHDQLLETLKRHGFEPRDDMGQPFDGRFHHGIAVGSQHGMPELSIIEVWERGWMRGIEVFRPAKVLVNKPSEEECPEMTLRDRNHD